jgi:hypothetical protein
MFLPAIILTFGLSGYSDFFSDMEIYHSPHDTGSIEEFADPRLPQPAILRASENMRNAVRQNKTNNSGLSQAFVVSVRYDANAMTMIKESEQTSVKKGIQLKLRI